MFFSIIIPTYNSGKLLPCCLKSILNQTFADFEILVMDGNSTDDTVEVAQSFNDERIKIFSEPDSGIYDAMNKGIGKATGDWLYFIGSDDSLYDEIVLETVYSLSNGFDFDVIYGDVKSQHLTEEYIGEWSIDMLHFNRCHQAIFYNKRLFDRFGLYATKYRIAADCDFNLKWFLNKKTNCKYHHFIVANHAYGGLSACPEGDVLFDKDFNCLVLKYGFLKFSWHYRFFYLKKILHKKIRMCLFVNSR